MKRKETELTTSIGVAQPVGESNDVDYCLLVRGVFDATASRLAIFTGNSAVLCLFTKQERCEAKLHRKATTKTTRLITFDLRWPSGTLIRHFEVFDLSVEQFKQSMDEGLIEEMPRAATGIAGNRLESYNIAWGTQMLQDGQWLSDYDIPQGATLTVLRQTQTAGPFF